MGCEADLPVTRTTLSVLACSPYFLALAGAVSAFPKTAPKANLTSMTRLLSPSTTDRDYWAIVDNLTRRGFFGVGAGVAAAAFLAACGSTESSTPENAETFEFTRGDEKLIIPTDPQNVVALDPRDGLELSILAGYPVTAYPTGAAEHLRREVPDATGVEIFAEGASDPNFEYISTLGADLLVLSAGWWDTGSYGNDRMQQIAPVLPVGKDFTPEWRKVMSDFLTGIGRSDRAEEVLAEYDAHVAQVRPTVEPLMAGKKVAFVAAAEDQIAWFQNDFRTAVAEDLGFEVLREGPDLRVMLGSEQFNRLEEADVIFALDRSASGSVYTSPTWQRLPAAQAGRVIPFDYYKAAGYALTAKVLVDDLAAGGQAVEPDLRQTRWAPIIRHRRLVLSRGPETRGTLGNHR